jgi:radical SAM protein with 4Fe4S-binding SPASM domain
MSDALTDIRRDQQRFDILNEIEKAESAFSENPNPAKAEELIGFWKEYIRIPRGYNSSSNKTLAYEQIALHNLYIETGKAPVFPILNYENSQSTIDRVVRVGNGFIVKSLDRHILQLIEEMTGTHPNYRNFRIKLVLEEVEETSCSTCPFFRRGCSGGCESINLDEFKKRRELAEKGQYLLMEGRL